MKFIPFIIWWHEKVESILDKICLKAIDWALARLLPLLLWIEAHKPKILKKHIIFITRWHPIVTTAFLMVGLICLLFDWSLVNHIPQLFGYAAFTTVLILPLSWYYGFCLWHQLLIYNLLILSLIAFIKSFNVFDDIIFIRILWISNTISIALAWVLYLLSEKIVQWKAIITKKLKCHG